MPSHRPVKRYVGRRVSCCYAEEVRVARLLLVHVFSFLSLNLCIQFTGFPCLNLLLFRTYDLGSLGRDVQAHSVFLDAGEGFGVAFRFELAGCHNFILAELQI